MGKATIERPEEKEASYIVTTATAVARFFGVTTAAVSKWASEAEPMPGRKGSYDLAAIARWKLRRTGKGGEENQDPLRAVDIRLKTAQAEAKELENALTRGNLVPVDKVDTWASIIMIELRESLMALPEVLATSSPPSLRDVVREESEDHIRGALIAAERRVAKHDYIDDETVEEE